MTAILSVGATAGLINQEIKKSQRSISNLEN